MLETIEANKKIIKMATIFSGADIQVVINKTFLPVLSFEMNDSYVSFILPLGNDAFWLIDKTSYVDVDIFGLTETGDKGLISGMFKYESFSIKNDIKELATEIRIIGAFTPIQMIGFFGVTEKQNQFIANKLSIIKQNNDLQNGRRQASDSRLSSQ